MSDQMIDLIVWVARLVLFGFLAYGGTRFWKHRPSALAGGVWRWMWAWRAHLLYFGGWLVYLIYTLVLRRGLSLAEAVPALATTAIIIGLVEFFGRNPDGPE